MQIEFKMQNSYIHSFVEMESGCQEMYVSIF